MTKNLIVYNASAGSGKTFILALEYIALCLRSNDPGYFRRILAITFTNKAAHELKERVILFLADLASESPDPIKMQELKKRCDLSAKDISAKAKTIHTSMLFDYGNIHVSTIDSFVLSILRAFSKELGMSFDFEVELDNTRVMEMLVDSIMGQVGRDRFITEQLARMVTQSLDEGSTWNPKRSMKDAIDHLMDEESIPYRQQLAKLGESELQEKLSKLIEHRNSLWKEVTDAQEKTRDLIAANGLDSSHFNLGSRGFISFAYKDLQTKTAPSAAQIKAVTEGKFSSGAAKKQKVVSQVEAVSESIAPLFYRVVEHLKELALVENLYRNRISLVLALRLQNLLKKLEDEEGISVIKDNNYKISSIIQDNPTPFIYERVGERFQHFLIDEFQDTSVLQWRNMLPLIDGSLSYGRTNFLVGDVKQSIYRFRGGEVDQMVELPDIPGSKDNPYLAQIAQNFKSSLENRLLESNYRSSPAVIEFNNRLFSHLSHSLPEHYQKSYADVRQKTERKNSGYVEMHALQPKANIEDSLERLMELIGRCETDGYHGSDICILIRNNKDGGVIAKHLEASGYGVSSPDSLLLSGHADVHLLMSFLELLSQQDTHAAELYITYRMLERMDKVADYHRYAAQVKDGRTAIQRVTALLAEHGVKWSAEQVMDKDPYYSLELLCQDLDISSRDAYVQELMNTAVAYSQRQESTMVGFCNYWQDKQGSLSVKAGMDRKNLQLMTIHKSKGLQFPVVILPLIKWESGKKTKKKEWLEMDEELLDIGLVSINGTLADTAHESVLQRELDKSTLDNLNLLYVGCTRAEDRMYMQVSNPSKGGIASQLLAYMQQHDQSELLTNGSEESRAKTEEVIEDSPTIGTYERNLRSDMLSLALSADDNPASKRALGELVHACLEKCQSTKESLVMLQQLMPEEDYSDEDRLFVKDSLDTAYRIENEQGWRSEDFEHRPEVSLIDSDGKGYRIDSLYLNRVRKKAIIVDYKTGHRDEKYITQLSGYKELLRLMGWTDVEAYLLFTESGELEAV